MDRRCDQLLAFALTLLSSSTGCQGPWHAWAPTAGSAPPITPVAATAPVEDPFDWIPAGPETGGAESSVQVPVAHAEWTWEQIVDVVDDYFRIQRERPVQVVGDVITAGRIDTYPQLGATVVEPHRPDSVGRYNCWESTLQTIRRRATLRIEPGGNGYVVFVQVLKELEDLPRPERATAGAATFRSDNSLPGLGSVDVSRTELSDAWIPMGRDLALEQQLLAEIKGRLAVQ
jgi:hypothetical protein